MRDFNNFAIMRLLILKKWLFLSAAIVGLSFVFLSSLLLVSLASFPNGERIKSFESEYVIKKNGDVDVREKIIYDFADFERHGIFRFIPIKYKTVSGNYNLKVSNVSVTDENSLLIRFTQDLSNNLKLTIGDPEKLVSGEKVYVINYTVKRAIKYFNDHDEFWWNATGDQWTVPIEKTHAKVIFEDSVNLGEAIPDLFCYQGYYGSKNECRSEWHGKQADFGNDEQVTLEPGQGMTIVVGWPPGIVKKPSFLEKTLFFIFDNWYVGLPIVTFLVIMWLWYRRGRDPKGRGVIVAEYEPPDQLDPAEIGAILDARVDSKDISAVIINLAIRGYLKIRRKEMKGFFGIKNVDYEFEKISDSQPQKEHEKKIFEAIFSNQKKEIALSELKKSFTESVSEITDKVYEAVVSGGYYVRNPDSSRGNWFVLGVVTAIGLPILLSISNPGFPAVMAGFISGLIIIIFSFFMPQTTRKGALTKEKILGFKEFLSVTETDRIKFHNAPDKNPEMFEKFLPYAMVLGVEKEWAEQFKDIYERQPSWYEDTSGATTNFNSVVLTRAVADFNASALNSIISSPKSAAGGGSGVGGGGFSGGGFGGGGGGSW